MTPHIESLKKYLLDRKHFQFRRTVDWDSLLPQWDIDRDKQAANVLKTVLAEEAKHPVFLPNERIVLTRTCANLPERYPDEVMERLRKEAYFHEKGVVFNLSPNFEDAISTGLDAKRAEAVARRERAIAENDGGPVAVPQSDRLAEIRSDMGLFVLGGFPLIKDTGIFCFQQM